MFSSVKQKKGTQLTPYKIVWAYCCYFVSVVNPKTYKKHIKVRFY